MAVTSLPMALVVLVFVYVLGHLSHQLKDLAGQTPHKILYHGVWVLNVILPSFHLLDASDAALGGSFSVQAVALGT